MALTLKDANNVDRTIMTALLNSEHVQQIGWAMATRSDTYTEAANGTTLDVSALGMRQFSLQVSETGTVTSWTVLLERSHDNVNFVQVLKHMKAGDGSETIEGNGAIADTGPVPVLARYFRSRCTAVVLGAGTNVIATIIGMP